jgi:hypothetical protein
MTMIRKLRINILHQEKRDSAISSVHTPFGEQVKSLMKPSNTWSEKFALKVARNCTAISTSQCFTTLIKYDSRFARYNQSSEIRDNQTMQYFL